MSRLSLRVAIEVHCNKPAHMENPKSSLNARYVNWLSRIEWVTITWDGNEVNGLPAHSLRDIVSRSQPAAR